MPILPVLILLYGAVTLLSLWRRSHWPGELLTHLRLQLIAAGAIGAGLTFAIGEAWEWASISAGLALVNYGALPGQRWIKPDAALAGQPGITVVWANVWQKRKPMERTLAWAKAQNADVIIVGEFPEADPAEILAGDYPHRLDTGPAPDKDYAVRMVAFSRLPIEGGMVREGPGPMHRPFVSMRVKIGEAAVNLMGAHPVPPYNSALLKERDRHIAMLGTMLKAPFVLLGDFNTTPWCLGYGAIPGRRVGGYLWAPTWFSNLPLLGLPIDHIMVSTGMTANVYRVGPLLGSDHRAILARVHLPSGANT